MAHGGTRAAAFALHLRLSICGVPLASTSEPDPSQMPDADAADALADGYAKARRFKDVEKAFSIGISSYA